MIFVLDTTAFSAAMRYDPEIISFLKNRRPGDIAAVPPVEAEIEYGIQRLDQSSKKAIILRTRKEELLSAIRLLPWSSESSRTYGIIKADLESKGTPIDDFDAAIGAIALSHGAVVITANLVYFKRIPDLESRHWI
jgi:tRNA(fMet)-specific endonuclease VapC